MSKYPETTAYSYTDMGNFTTTTEFKFLVCGNIDNNANKFYSLELQTDGSAYRLFSHYGRIGQTGAYGIRVMPDEKSALKEFGRIIKGKKGKGYNEIELAVPSIGSKNIRKQIIEVSSNVSFDKFEPKIQSLVNFFVEENIHNILGKTALTLTGRGLETPLGPVSHTQIKRARDLLRELSENPSNASMNLYYSLIPRVAKVMKPLDDDGFSKESELLDQIESAISCENKEDLPFNLVECDHKPIAANFEATRASNHGNLRDWKVKRAFSVERSTNDFKDDGNIVKVWHGSGTCNTLSILVNGLTIPLRPSTGRMFGPAIYGAINSTKALNYSTGFWHNRSGSNRGDTAYLFVAEFSMGGNIYYPRTSFSNRISDPHTSAWAKRELANLYNDELMVYDVKRCRLVNLVELTK
jgi:predicted DNA-binding WGR domain protein